MITVLAASAVPLKIGVVSLVVLPSMIVPVIGAALSLRVPMAASGKSVSTVKLIAVLAGLWLPAWSSTTVVKLCSPSVRAVAVAV